VHEPAFRQDAEHLLDVVAPVLLRGRERQLERGALHVLDENVQVVRIDERVLGRRVEEVRRIADDELIERRAAPDEHGRRAPGAPPRASGPLPCRGNRPRIAGHHAYIQRPDVDAQLERVGRDHRAHAAFAQPFFDLTPPLRQVSPSIAANLFLRARRP
jgi:hypothetical protein